jgi:hypothetical protein
VVFDLTREEDAGEGVSKGKSASIEFRQHRGTLDYADIIAWLDVVACLVDTCRDMANFHDRYLLVDCVSETTFKLDDLLQAIGVQKYTRDQYSWRLSGGDGENGTAGAERVVAMRRATGEAAEVVRRVEKERWLNRRDDRVKRFIARYERAGGFGSLEV